MSAMLSSNDPSLNLEAEWLEWLSRTLPLQPEDVVFRVAGHEWAASPSEVAWVQQAGASLVEGPQDDPDAWANICALHRVSVACIWPSSLALLQNVAKQTDLASLRVVICGGETLLADVARSLLRHTRAELIYFHAPQFLPPIFCGQIREESLLAEHVSAGWVCGAWEVELLDDHGRPVPRGVVGHIVVRSTLGGERIRIGERGRLLRDGSVMIAVGLNQAGWIRGHYIDVGIVNSIMLNMPEISDCHVALRRIAGFGFALLAWVVPKSNMHGDQIRAAIDGKLSPRLLPTAVMLVTALPLTHQGDVDVASLEDLPAWQLGSERLLQRRLMDCAGVEDAVAFLLPAPPLTENEADRNSWCDGLLECKPGESERLGSEALTDTTNLGALVVCEPLPSGDACLLEQLVRTVEHRPYQRIRFVSADGVVTELCYHNLLQASSRVLRGLRRQGLKAGDFLILQLADQQQFIIGFWACVLGGVVPIPVSVPVNYSDNSAAVRKLSNTWRMLQAARTLTDEMRADDIDRLLRQANSHVSVTLCIEQLLENEEDRDWHLASPDDLALMLLTSGSSGAPKVVMHSHRTLLSRCEATRLHRGYTEHDISLNWLPLDHVGAIVMFHLRDVVLGCEQIHVDTDYVLVDPLRWLDLIHRMRSTVTWAPNFAYALINGQSDVVRHRSWDLSCLRVLINAGEVVVPRTARRFIELLKPKGLPDDAMKPEWGMSETSSAVTGSKGFLLADTRDDDLFVLLGAPLPGVELRVVGGGAGCDGLPLVGRLQVRGPMVTLGYFGNVEATNEAFANDGWFETGDLACLKNGQLAIVGRHKDSIIVNGVNFLAHEIEAVVDELPGMLRSFTVAIAYRPPNSNTDSVVVFFVPEDRSLVPALLESIRQQVGHTFKLQVAHVVPALAHEIPKTTIGKVQRAELRRRFEQGEFADRLRRITDAQLQSRLHQHSATVRWCRIALMRSTLPSTSFSVCAANTTLADSVADILRLSGMQAQVLTAEQVLSGWCNDTLVYLGALESEQLPMAERAEHLILECGGIVRAMLASSVDGSRRRFVVVTRQAVGALPEEAIDCAGAALGAWIKSVSQELPGIVCQQIDIATVDNGISSLSDELLYDEVEPIVARRNGYRYVPRLQRLSSPASVGYAGAALLQHGSLYLLAGGLGGVGLAIARRLVQELDARLLLVGRRQRDELVDAQLREAGLPVQAVLYASCDICSAPEALRAVVAEAETHFGQSLGGVFHLAAESGLAERWTQLERQGVLYGTTQDQIRANLRSKTVGTHNLIALLADRVGTPFIAFSSVTASFGAPGLAEYAAANAYISAYCAEQRRQGHRQTYTIEWSMWEDTGLARQIPTAARERLAQQGYAAWSPSLSLDAMMEYLQETMVQPLLLGITNAHPDWSHRGAMPWRGAECLRGYITGASVGVATLPKLSLRDGLGRIQPCELVHLSGLPRDASREVDRQWLCDQLGLRIRGSTPFVGPRTKAEQHLAAIWQSLLNVGEVSVYDNFFEVGGHSLLATQVVSRLRSELGVELPLRQIFETPTLEVQAQCLERLLERGWQSQIPRAIRRTVTAAQLGEVLK